MDAQVLIALPFGDNLNTGNIEVGLEGGATFSTISGLPGAKNWSGLNLSLYFDTKTKSRVHSCSMEKVFGIHR